MSTEVLPQVEANEVEVSLREQLDAARSRWAHFSAKRQRRMGDYKGVRALHGYNDAKEQYERLVLENAKSDLADALGETTDETTRNALAIGYWAHETNNLREEIRNEVEGTTRWKVAHAIGSWLNRGSRATRIAKGAAVVTGAGVVLGATAGAAGVGAAVGGAVAAVKYGRTWLSRHRGGMESLHDDTRLDVTTDEETDVETLLERIHERSLQVHETDSKREQMQNRTTVYIAAGSVAVGSVLGHVIGGHIMPKASAETTPNDHYVSPKLTHPTEPKSPGIADMSEPKSPEISHVAEPKSPSVTESTVPKSPGVTEPSEPKSPDIAADTPLNPSVTTPEGVDQKLSRPFTVEVEHGYTQEIIDAGQSQGITISPQQALDIHKSIVDKVGSDYINLIDHSGADTYSMGGSAYDTGIAAPGQATWDPRALDILRDSLAHHTDATEGMPQSPGIQATPSVDYHTSGFSYGAELGTHHSPNLVQGPPAPDAVSPKVDVPVSPKIIGGDELKRWVESNQMSNFNRLSQMDLRSLYASLGAETYGDANHTPIIVQNALGQFHVNPAPFGAEVSTSTRDVIFSQISKHDFDLAV